MPKQRVFNKVKSFVIDRRRWFRGGDAVDSYLLLPNSTQMCCLGHFGRALGYKPKELRGTGTPENCVNTEGMKAARLVGDSGYNTKVCNEMMIINDNVCITDATRESKLTKLFAKIGVKVKFVN